jgi:hypothetical protein
MNAKTEQNRKHQGQKTRQQQGPGKRGPNLKIQQDHEHPETRLTR